MPAAPQPNPAGDAASPFSAPIRIVDPLCAVFRQRLRAEGLKYTPERARILSTVMEFEGVFEADAVLERARQGGQRVSKATVYRTMRLLQESGIVQRVPFDDEQAHYVLAYGREDDASAIVIRLDTREMLPVDIPELAAIRDRACRAMGLKAVGHRVQIFAKAEK